MLQILQYLFNSKYLWVTTFLIGIYIYLKFYVYAYWKNQGVPHERPVIPFGNILPVFLQKLHIGNFIKDNYDKFKKYDYHGIYVFHRPVLVITNPVLIHQILIKQFDKFNDRGVFCNEKIDPLTDSIFLLSGEKWKKLRTKLSPTFTPKKLKQMFPLIKEISYSLIKTCDKIITENDIIEMKDLMSRYTTDTISSIAFGFNCESLKDPDNDFKRYGVMAFDLPQIKILIATYAPKILYTLRLPYYKKEMTRFFIKTFQKSVEHRKQSKIIRKDFLDSLINLMDNGMLENNEDMSDNLTNSNKITMNEAQSQAFIFFLGGFETSSATMTYLLYELALNPEIQKKVHEEIDEFLANGEPTYDRIQVELKYLDMVLSETMRKHPTFSFLNRLCNSDWRIPNSDFTIKKGTAILIPIYGLHHDTNVYPDPEKFYPNRFLNDSTRPSSYYLPFGGGPKYCIGSKFAILQMKLALVAMLSNYNFSKCKKTVIPMQYSKRAFTQSPGSGVYLRMKKRLRNH